MEFPHGTISIDTQPDKFTIEFLWWNWWNCCSWILISLLLQLNCHFIPLLLMMMIKQRKFWDALFHISYISIPVSKGISQSKRNFTTSKNCLHKKVSCEVSPIFYEFFFLPWPWNVMNFLDIPAPCWSCKVCKKKVLCGFEKCLVSKVVFYIMLDVAWNSVVVGFQPKKNWKNSLSFLEWRMCFRNPNLDQQHPLQAVLPNCPLAKNRNRTSRAWAWRGPHPLHIIVFSVRWPAKASNDKISKLSCKIQHGQNICTMKVCSTCAFEEKSFLIYWSLFIPPFCPCFGIHTKN